MCENFVINCYRLAERFRCDPELFLSKPYSIIDRHFIWLEKMDAGQRAEEAWQEKLLNG